MNQGHNVLRLAEMQEEYCPPKEIWHHPERVKQFFDALSRKQSGTEIQHDPSIDVTEAAEYRKANGLPPV